MRRRTFCRNSIAVAAAATMPGCGPRGDGPAADVGRTVPATGLDGGEIALESSAIDDLAASLGGHVYLPEDAGYDGAKQVWNGMFADRKPALVVQCASTGDVVNAINFGRDQGILLSVKCGGHSLPGKSTSNGGMMIDMSQMRNVEVDTSAKTMRADGGVLLGHLDAAATAHDLLTTTGIVSHTGAGGFTLGGGLGRTDRKMGLSIDNLLAATVVTADGRVVRASEEENPDLFWGIRGGGGNFGVVTEFVYRLHPFNPVVYGGDLYYPVDQDFLSFYGELHETLPDEANVEPQLFRGDDGKPVALVEVTWCGDHARGEKVLAPMLKYPGLVSGELGPFEYRSLQTRADAPLGHGVRSYLKSGFLPELTPTAIDVIVEYSHREGPVLSWFQHMGGATSRVAVDATAYPHRGAAFNYGIMYVGMDPAQDEVAIAAVREFYAEMEPHMSGFYTNLNEDTERKTWGNYGVSYPRLVELKNKYDPGNVFRLNANVKPTA